MKKLKIADNLFYKDLEKVAPIKNIESPDDEEESSFEAGVIQRNQMKAVQELEGMTKESIKAVRFLLKSVENSIASKSLQVTLQNLEGAVKELSVAEKFLQ
jgi:hypothetical protein